MKRATITFAIPGHTSLDERDSLVEKVRETALPVLSADGRSLTIRWEEADEWELRGRVQETLDVLESDYQIRLDIEQVQRGDETNGA